MTSGAAACPRTDIAAFFDGLELVDPGLEFTSRWRPQEPARSRQPVDLYGGAGRKS